MARRPKSVKQSNYEAQLIPLEKSILKLLRNLDAIQEEIDGLPKPKTTRETALEGQAAAVEALAFKGLDKLVFIQDQILILEGRRNK